MYVCIHICIYTYIYTDIHIYIYVCIYMFLRCMGLRLGHNIRNMYSPVRLLSCKYRVVGCVFAGMRCQYVRVWEKHCCSTNWKICAIHPIEHGRCSTGVQQHLIPAKAVHDWKIVRTHLLVKRNNVSMACSRTFICWLRVHSPFLQPSPAMDSPVDLQAAQGPWAAQAAPSAK